MNQYFATCPRGLEALLANEMNVAGAKEIKPTDGGVSFAGELSVCYAANLHSRMATRILMQVGQGRYATEDDLYQAAYKINWPNWFDVKHDFMVKVTGVKCPLKSLEFATLRIKDAVCDKFRQVVDSRPYIDTKTPAVRIHAYLTADAYVYYIDTSGDALYMRGNRKASIEAPLRENLAAGILQLSGWQAGQPLLDPMCGSGTFLLEAAMMALNSAFIPREFVPSRQSPVHAAPGNPLVAQMLAHIPSSRFLSPSQSKNVSENSREAAPLGSASAASS